MYYELLKKDLKRQKSLNMIVLIFIILATTFISSSINNLIGTSVAMKNYFDKAEIGDYSIFTLEDIKNNEGIKEYLNNSKNIEKWVSDEFIMVFKDNIKKDNSSKMNGIPVFGGIMPFRIKGQKFFDIHNREIEDIKDGEIYLPNKILSTNNWKIGDEIKIVNNEYEKEFVIKGEFKDALLGSAFFGAARMLVNDNEYKEMKLNSSFNKGYIYDINASDIKALKKEINNEDFIMFAMFDKGMVERTYVLDKVISGALLIVSAALILISLIILRFTILFTINEEYHDIGVMKAIGIKARKIRYLYIVKYLFIALFGSIIGFVLSFPFSDLFRRQISKNIMIENASNGIWMALIASVTTVLIVIGFCYFCTSHVNQYTPVDAIRNGSNGERFKRKGLIRLNQLKLPPVIFLALNDILSGMKRFSILAVTFTIGFLLIFILVNTKNTLKSDQLLDWFSVGKADVFIVAELDSRKPKAIQDDVNEIKRNLQKNGMNADIFYETQFQYRIINGDKSLKEIGYIGTGISTDQYNYTKGVPPQYADEIAITKRVAEDIDANIGDRIKIKMFEEEREFIITAFYQTMENMGYGVRFSEHAEMDYNYVVGVLALQIKFDDKPSPKEKQERLKKIKELYPERDIMNGEKYLEVLTGNTSKIIDSFNKVVIVVVIAINILIAILMVKTFMINEKGIIAMLKSIGFKNYSIILWQVARIGLILLFSAVLAVILSGPIAKITSGNVFVMMGASKIDFVINPLEIYLIYPFLVLAATLLASGITAQGIRKISSWEVNRIE